MNSIAYTSGNAVRDGQSNTPKGWFIGHFIPSECGLAARADLEVKWGVHHAGESKETPSTNALQTTLTLLISGRFEVRFLELNRTVTLADAGDYVIFAPGVKHHWNCLDDCVVVTIRWPSEPSER